ncbi:hypothetical protein [Corynebacterium tapiri]|uniref:hypothetical protein n=1 Tax=Corynebacterium tapiri TaxID=1448266 RepID=UPI0015D59D71|nr:hypothetical protein [Corynebacterium tapiri]
MIRTITARNELKLQVIESAIEHGRHIASSVIHVVIDGPNYLTPTQEVSEKVGP